MATSDGFRISRWVLSQDVWHQAIVDPRINRGGFLPGMFVEFWQTIAGQAKHRH